VVGGELASNVHGSAPVTYDLDFWNKGSRQKLKPRVTLLPRFAKSAWCAKRSAFCRRWDGFARSELHLGYRTW